MGRLNAAGTALENFGSSLTGSDVAAERGTFDSDVASQKLASETAVKDAQDARLASSYEAMRNAERVGERSSRVVVASRTGAG